MDYLTAWHGAGAYALGLVLTLVLAAHLTPRRWWKRANARALLILAGGSWGLGSLLLWQAHAGAAAPPAPAPSPTAAIAAVIPAPAPAPAPAPPPPASAGLAFRTHDALNLRAGPGVSATRLLVVPAGAIVTPTGARSGDWWQVTARVGGAEQSGWASSLWLRRQDEQRR